MKVQLTVLSVPQGDVTPQEVMQMKSFRHFTEEQAIELLRVYDIFCDLAFRIIAAEESSADTQIIPLTPPLQQKVA